MGMSSCPVSYLQCPCSTPQCSMDAIKPSISGISTCNSSQSSFASHFQVVPSGFQVNEMRSDDRNICLVVLVLRPSQVGAGPKMIHSAVGHGDPQTHPPVDPYLTHIGPPQGYSAPER